MNRLWLGIGILLVLLALGLFCLAATEDFHTGVTRDLASAAEAAGAGEWHRAQVLFFQAKDTWERARSRNAAITDHAPMEEIDRFFAQGTVYAQQQARTEFCACCNALSVLVEAVAEAQGLSWWSLL